MKKIILMAAFALAATMSISTDAAVYYPSAILLNSSTSTFSGGATEPIQLFMSPRADMSDKLVYEIGVSREVKQGNITQFEILSANTVSAKDIPSNLIYNLTIPNGIGSTPGTTYIAYVRSYLPNNPESEDLIISSSFKIKNSNQPYVGFVGGAMMLSNGESFGFKTGPIIYKEAKTTSYATSAKLVLDFSSNTSTTITPAMTFTKLRSSSFNENVPVGKINITSGSNSKVIDLPTFNYEPGVYMGTLTLQSDKEVGLIKEIKFQYIIDGPIVTVGQMAFISDTDGIYKFSIPTFGKPADIYTPGIATTTSTSSEAYQTTFTFLSASGKSITSTTTVVDYKVLNHMLTLDNGKLKNATKVNIKVYDGDKVFFETTQDLSLPTLKRSCDNLIYAGIILLLGLAWFFVVRRKSILIITIILAAIFTLAYTVAADWNPPILTPPGDKFYDDNHTIALTLNKNFTTENVACNATPVPGGTPVLAKLEIITCTNTVDTVYIGSSRTSNADAKTNKVQVTYYGTASTSVPGHNKVFKYNLNWINIGNIVGPVVANSFLFIHTGMYMEGIDVRCFSSSCTGSTYYGYADYKIPLSVTPSCDRCSNVSGNQVTPNFQAHGRDYFFVASPEGDGTLYFAPAMAGSGQATTPTVCNIDMCADTSAIEDLEIPSGMKWKNTGTTDYEKYSCVPITPEVCSCNGTRTYTCLEDGVVTSTTPNASQCSLQASCSSSPNPLTSNQVTFTFYATGNIGSVSWNGPNPITVAIPPNGEVDVSRIAIDAYDGLASNDADCSANWNSIVWPGNLQASCSAVKNAEQTEATFTYSASNANGPVTYSGYSGSNPITVSLPANGGLVTVTRNVSDGDETVPATCSAQNTNPTEDQDSEIITFTASPIVDQGSSCVFNWTTQDMASCTIGGVATAVNGTESFSTTAGRNVIKTLTCVAADPAPATSQSLTKTCLVRPKVNEN